MTNNDQKLMREISFERVFGSRDRRRDAEFVTRKKSETEEENEDEPCPWLYDKEGKPKQ